MDHSCKMEHGRWGIGKLFLAKEITNEILYLKISGLSPVSLQQAGGGSPHPAGVCCVTWGVLLWERIVFGGLCLISVHEVCILRSYVCFNTKIIVGLRFIFKIKYSHTTDTPERCPGFIPWLLIPQLSEMSQRAFNLQLIRQPARAIASMQSDWNLNFILK